MLHKIDHVGIAVTDIEEAIKTYQGLGFTLKGRDRVDSQKVETAFFQIGESCIELIAATEPIAPSQNSSKKMQAKEVSSNWPSQSQISRLSLHVSKTKATR